MRVAAISTMSVSLDVLTPRASNFSKAKPSEIVDGDPKIVCVSRSGSGRLIFRCKSVSEILIRLPSATWSRRGSIERTHRSSVDLRQGVRIPPVLLTRALDAPHPHDCLVRHVPKYILIRIWQKRNAFNVIRMCSLTCENWPITFLNIKIFPACFI